MLKDYVTKWLQFLQIRPSKGAGKQEEETPLQPPPASVEPGDTPKASPLPAGAPEDDWDDDPFAEPLPPERAPGQEDYEAGILA